MLIILLMITLGTIGISWVFFRAQQITNATRHGARVAIRYGATTGDVEQGVADCLNPVGCHYTGPTIPTGINPDVGEPVEVIVEGTGLDILNLNNLGMLKLSMPDKFKASVTMAKEGP